MGNEFVPYEQALALKQLGFDEPCFGEFRQWDGNEPYLQLYQDLDGCSTDPADFEYTVECPAPTWQQAFRWFREKHLIDVAILKMPIIDKGWMYYFQIEHAPLLKDTEHYFDIFFETYEEAELECLKKLIKIVKESKS